MTTLRRSIAVPTALLTVAAGAALAYLGWDTAAVARSARRDVGAVRAATALTVALSDAVHEEERWVAALASGHGDEAPVAGADLRIAQLIREIDALSLDPDSRAGGVWASFVEARVALRPLRREVLAAARSRDPRALARAVDRWHLMSDRADALLKNVSAYQLRLLDRTVAETQRRHARALGTAAATVALGLLVAAAFSRRIARTVVRPIEAMARAAERVTASGPFCAVAGGERRDEIGVLARSFNAMTARLVAANARLAEAVKAREEFISIASHELRTPITPLHLRVQQLVRGLERRAGGAGPDEAVRSARTLERHVTRLGKLVDNMLDVSRITSGRLSLAPEEVSMVEVVRDALDRISDELSAGGCVTRIECTGDVRVRADRSRLEQVLLNLAGNAAKYAPGSPVVVRVRTDRGDAVVEVEDAGPGIAPEDHERIFTRFERGAGDRRDVSGLGLGLFIAREIVRAHGGEISVRSEAGRGAVFAVRLPLDASGRPPARGGLPAPGKEPPTSELGA